MNVNKPSSKRLRQSSLADFVQITKMSKVPKQASTNDQEADNRIYNICANNCENLPEVLLELVVPSVSSQSTVVVPSIDVSATIETKKDNIIKEDSLSKDVNECDLQETVNLCSQNSVELFPSETDQSVESDCSSPEDTSGDFRRSTVNPPQLPQLHPSEDHSVLFNYNIIPGRPPLPYPNVYKDKWDNNYVRLPCSNNNKYFVLNATTGEDQLKSRWEVIQSALLNNIRSSIDLEEAILTYNSQYSGKWNFQGLHRFFTEKLEPEETTSFFDNLLPKMIRLCFQLPDICTQPIPLLKSKMDYKVTLSQQQIGVLLANAFFCTFPRRNSQSSSSEYSSYPDINFNKLFSPHGRRNTKMEKLKCLLNYFNRITRKVPDGILTFHRQNVTEFPRWNSSNKKLGKLHVQSHGLIELDGIGMLQMDFANKFVGGGVISTGCVQEEIRFIICPELIISRLFTERLLDNEVLIITGCEQFNEYSGHAETFQWTGNFEDHIPRDSWQRRLTQVVAMDALHFVSKDVQYEPRHIRRELEKSYTGFVDFNSQKSFLPAVATGNWGCGTFGGDPRLKVLIQLISASEAGRDLFYLTFKDEVLQKDIQKMYGFLKNRRVGQIVKMLEDYYLQLNHSDKKLSLYGFLFTALSRLSSESDTDIDP